MQICSHKLMEILDLGERDEDAQLTRFSTILVSKSVVRKYVDVCYLKEQDKNTHLNGIPV